MKQKFRKGDIVVTLYVDNMPSKVEIIDVLKKDDFIYLAKDKDGIIQGFFDHEIGLISRGYEWKMVQNIFKELASEFSDYAFPEDKKLNLKDIMKILRFNGYEDEQVF